MRKSEGDIKFETLHHCCIHSHTKTYLDKAVDKEKAAWPSNGQGPGKAVVKGPPTRTMDKRDRQTRTRPVQARHTRTHAHTHTDKPARQTQQTKQGLDNDNVNCLWSKRFFVSLAASLRRLRGYVS